MPLGAPRVVDLCVPVVSAPPLGQPDVVLHVISGRFVLVPGDSARVPEFLRAARAFASARGLPFERGSIEVYRRSDGEEVRVDAGVRIHD